MIPACSSSYSRKYLTLFQLSHVVTVEFVKECPCGSVFVGIIEAGNVEGLCF